MMDGIDNARGQQPYPEREAMNMTITQLHYDEHLGPIYEWMVGGTDAALDQGAAEVTKLGAVVPDRGLAIDLGAGFGMHTLPLARRGLRVLAIDSCAVLLDALRARCAELPIEIIHDELQSFRNHLTEPAQLIFCMGDTLTHLPDDQAIEDLVSDVAAALAPGGHFIATFRDYTDERAGTDRFIAVRSDTARMHTCFLEYVDTHVIVHDILHERQQRKEEWRMRVSAYPKLRMAPDWLASRLHAHGFTVSTDRGPAGMIQVVAQKERPDG